MGKGAILSVSVLLLALAPAPADAGRGVAARRGQQARKARLELVRARALEAGALSGSSDQPATDLFRAEALRSRARARLALIDRLVERGLSRPKTVRDHLADARRNEAAAREVAADLGTQALFRQRLIDAQGERAYWTRMGAYGPRYRPPRKRVSRTPPRIEVRSVEHLEAARQARTYRAGARDRDRIRGKAQPAERSQMIRSRPLRYYWTAFGPAFERVLDQMTAADAWIDVGAGQGMALAGYASSWPEGGQVIAIDLVDDASAQAARFPAGRFRVLEGDVRRVRVDRTARLVTDVFGAVSYGDAPDRVMRRYGELLEPGGQAMIFLEEQRNTILSSDGRTSEDLIGYLGRVDGFAIEEVRPFNEGTAVILRRTAGPVKAPRLELVEFADGGPPTRVFRMVRKGELAEPVRSRFAPMQRR